MPTIFIFCFADCVAKIVTNIPDLTVVTLCDDPTASHPPDAEQIPLVLLPDARDIELSSGTGVYEFSSEEVEYDPDQADRITQAIIDSDYFESHDEESS